MRKEVIVDQEEDIDKSRSGEQLNALLSFLEELPPASLNRNDPCLCRSGKKYKKCCLEKDRSASSFPEVQLDSFQIKTDALTPEESKNNFPALSEEDEELVAALYHNLHEHPETIDSENCDYFRRLNELRIKYPDNPMILNYIANGYQQLGWQGKVHELVTETYEKFPDYLFALVAQANIYLINGSTEKALETLKGACTLKQLYPHRTIFHISEVRAFEYFMVGYFCTTENVKQAEIHLQLMKDVLEEDDALLQSAQKMVKKTKGLYNFKAGLSRLLRLSNKE